MIKLFKVVIVVVVISLIACSGIAVAVTPRTTQGAAAVNLPSTSTNDSATIITTTVQETTVQPTTQPQTTEQIKEEPTTVKVTEYSESDEDEYSVVEDNEEELSKEKPHNNETNSGYLLEIDSPDSEYSPQPYSLSESERYTIACVVMGEFGGGGFTGCTLIAQAYRDAMQTYGYSASSVISNMQYYGYNSEPNEDSYAAVDYIFSGNAAVQHRVLYMNNSDGGWHATQNFVVYYDGVWFYD